LQHLNYPSQLAAKTQILKDTFYRIGGFHPPEPQVFPSNPWEYRNRVQLHCIKRRQYGMKAKKSGEIIPVADCPIADPGIRNFLKGEGDQSFSPPPEKDRFTVYARGGLFLGEGGTLRGKTQILDRELVLDAGVFFQSNGMMLEKLVTDLREIAVGAGAIRNLPMADLYCGVGTFAVFLGEFFPHADLVEENKTALALARENFLQISGGNTPAVSAGYFAQRGEDWVKNADCRRYGFIVADPPRHGLAPEIARRLAADGPSLFVYVSCDPATMARDSKILLAGGYKLKELRLYDFYPQTAHIESLAVFVR
jgi:23S rRNA (uracil1939-C5)-methyltransferase